MSIIGLDYTPAYEQGGGIGRYVRELVAALAIQDQSAEYKLFVAGVPTLLVAPPGQNFSWRTTRITPQWLARLWHRARIPLPVEIFTGGLSLYHATDFVLPPTLSRTRTLLTVHDLSFVRVPDTASPSLKAYLDRVVPYSTRHADHILADSQATKLDLIDLYGITPEKISVLLSGVDAVFQPVNDPERLLTMRMKYAINKVPYIFSVGTVQPRKNYGRLIQSLAHLRNSNYDVQLVIAGGPGWLEDPIYKTISQENMQDHVHFIGFVDDRDLPSLYSGALCCAFPSLYEGFGLPILEAMACGTPVITSNISSLPEVAGTAAIIVDPYNVDELTQGIQTLIEDQALRDNLIILGHQRANQFTWESSARQLRQIYQRLLT